eukprot:gnl/TRDRNA2_/TRDRNA2_153115_c0_seq1.p1 gnl/TRDRNA2_/TRDRNA2_153115_c0~~gnl/TRDRNA2_/TRDRNA2_153115_c0_seq1.p1  ORF type:complete len:513 (+),score=97.25 gnl/TRDRNA2_/TRDRNA2_153115_c0_seq1:193-1539(+)
MTVMRIFIEISENFAELFELAEEVKMRIEPLKALTYCFNLETDLRAWKRVNRRRRRTTAASRSTLFGKSSRQDESGMSPLRSPQKPETTQFKSDLIKLELQGVCFEYFHEQLLIKDVNLSVAQGNLVAVIGPHGSGRATFMRLLGHTLFPTEGHIFIPSHLRILHVSHEPMFLGLSAWANLIFGCTNKSDVDAARIRGLLETLDMRQTLHLVEKQLEQAADGGGNNNAEDKTQDEIVVCCSQSLDVCDNDALEDTADGDEYDQAFNREVAEKSGGRMEQGRGSIRKDDDHESAVRVEGGVDWRDLLSYTEKVKVHLARALIMNPEVLVLSRPLHHYDDETSREVLSIIKAHVRARGLLLPEETCHRRRPRTCFYSPESPKHANMADTRWYFEVEHHTVRELEAEAGPEHFTSLTASSPIKRLSMRMSTRDNMAEHTNGGSPATSTLRM